MFQWILCVTRPRYVELSAHEQPSLISRKNRPATSFKASNSSNRSVVEQDPVLDVYCSAGFAKRYGRDFVLPRAELMRDLLPSLASQALDPFTSSDADGITLCSTQIG